MLRRCSFAFIAFIPLAACGDDAASTLDVTDTTSDTGTPFDTNPDKDTPGETSGGNRPPELERIGDRTVAVGQTLTITLSAKDPDGDALTFSVFGNLPEGARFDKAEHRFTWAPNEAGKTVFLTFVVSDGTDFDRETVRIQVTATATANPPVFADVGDQILQVGAPYALQLVATDPDGDRLTYGHEGALPAGATLDAQSGLFSWRPNAEAVGTPVRITFTVSDGSASDTMTVRFVVDDGGGSVQKPPVFTQIPAQTVRVGETLTLTLQATDPNGDALTFSIQGAVPPGASLSGATFTYTARQSEVGQTLQVTFAASDGTFTAVTTVKISVTSGQSTGCTPDPEEPNEDIASATPLTPGTRTATLCETATSYDLDTYAIALTAGQELRAKLTFDSNLGDVDLLLVDANENFLASSDGVTSVEELRYAAQSAMQVYLVVFGYGLEPLTLSYTLETSLSIAASCQDDGYEDNDTPAQARALDAQAASAVHQICAGDLDYWSFSVGCGARVEVIMDILDQVDLDLALYDNLQAAGSPVAIAISEDPTEYIEVAMAQRPGTWLIEVSGYPAASAEGRYELVASASGACQDDAQGGSSRGAARALAGTSGTLAGLRVCCSDDWYSFALAAGDQVIVDLMIAGAGSLGGVVYAGDGTTQLAAKDPSPAGGLVFFSATSAGTYYLKVTGAVGTGYGLEWEIDAASAGCDALSCPKYDVCDSASGQCVIDYCALDDDCPGGYVCRETYCVNACVSNGDCRPGYACKHFDDVTLARYCGVVGPGASGADCDDHSGCQAELACLFEGDFGYCAALDCGACPSGTQCASARGLAFCAKTCNTNADCRQADGYTCSAEKTCLPQNP